jgi:signal transduction histidine kinase
VQLTLPVSRNVLLVGVEAVHNAVKHAGATRVVVELAPEGRRWRLSVRDDGRGFAGGAVPADGEGLGLASMRRRAEEIGAQISWEAGSGTGVTVTLVFDPAAPGRSGGRASYDHRTGRAPGPAA